MLLLALLLNFHTLNFQPEIIDGYLGKLSAFPGDSIDVYVNASSYSSKFTLRLYDMSEKVVHSVTTSVFPQAGFSERMYEAGFRYKRTCRIVIPQIPSGVYLWENKIPMVVKSRTALITVLYPSNTAAAYSNSGGKSLYGFNSTDAVGAHTVSFHRPIGLEKYSEAFLRWLHRSKFSDVGYVTDADMDDFKSISHAKLLIIPGHSEYWTLAARRNFDRFVQTGKHAMVLSGNTMWWQVRYNKAKDKMICYRDAGLDPIRNEALKTINWHEPSLKYPIVTSIGADFSNGGYGVKYKDNGWDGFKIIADSPLFEGTSIKKNDILKCPADEVDGTPILSFVDGVPVIDNGPLAFFRIELVGYDHIQRGGKNGIATWIVFRSTSSSGIVINTASTDWCSDKGIGTNHSIRIITSNMIRKLINDENVFTIGDQGSAPN